MRLRLGACRLEIIHKPLKPFFLISKLTLSDRKRGEQHLEAGVATRMGTPQDLPA